MFPTKVPPTQPTEIPIVCGKIRYSPNASNLKASTTCLDVECDALIGHAELSVLLVACGMNAEYIFFQTRQPRSLQSKRFT